jgi:hypothetical protein
VLDAITSSTRPRFNRVANPHKAPRTLNDPVGSSASSFNQTRFPTLSLKYGAATNRVAPKYPARNRSASRIAASAGRICKLASLTPELIAPPNPSHRLAFALAASSPPSEFASIRFENIVSS